MLNRLDRNDIISIIGRCLQAKGIIVESHKMLLNDVYIVNSKLIYKVKFQIDKSSLSENIELSHLAYNNGVYKEEIENLFIVLTGLKNINESFIEVEYSCIYNEDSKLNICRISKGLEKQFNNLNDFKIIFDNDKYYIYTNVDLDFEFFDSFVSDLHNENIIFIREKQSNILYKFTEYKNIYIFTEI